MNHATATIARLLARNSKYSEALYVQAHLMHLGLHRDKAFELLREIVQSLPLRITATTVIFPRCEELEQLAEASLYACCLRECPTFPDGSLDMRRAYPPLRQFMARKASEIVLGIFTPWPQEQP